MDRITTEQFSLTNCHVLEGLSKLQSNSVDCIVTSPPIGD